MRRTKDGNGNMVKKLKMKIIKYTNADEDKKDEGEREIKRQKRKKQNRSKTARQD